MILGIQLLGIVFCIIMIYFTYVHYKRKNYGVQSLTLWSVVWLGALFVVSFPQTLYGIMNTLKIERTADFLTLLGFAFFALIIFYLYTTVKKNNKKIEELVRTMALNNVNTKEKQNLKRKK